MKVYIASPWEHANQAAAAAAEVEKAGFVITHKWWTVEGGDDPVQLRLQAIADFAGVRAADVVVLLQTGKSEGKAVETGMALAAGLPVFIVRTPGVEGNIFHYLPNVFLVDSVDEVVTALKVMHYRDSCVRRGGR